MSARVVGEAWQFTVENLCSLSRLYTAKNVRYHSIEQASVLYVAQGVLAKSTEGLGLHFLMYDVTCMIATLTIAPNFVALLDDYSSCDTIGKHRCC